MSTPDRPLLPRGDFTLRQLECFVAVAEFGSISRAAQALHASESAVADAVSSLERVMGTPLLNRRRSRGATLTSSGASALPLAKELLGRAGELSLIVRGGDENRLRGPIRVGAFHTLAPSILPKLISGFAELHPDVELDYTLADQDELAVRLADGDLDVAMVYDIDFPPEFERSILLRTRAYLVVADDHRLARRPHVSLDEVVDEPMVLLDVAPSRQHTLEIMSQLGVTPRIGHRTGNYDLVRALVGRGLGYTLLMGRRFTPETWDGGRVVSIPVVPTTRTIDVVLARRAGVHPRRVDELLAFAGTTIADELDGGPTGTESFVPRVAR